MDNIKDDRYYIDKMVKDTQFIIDHMQGITIEADNGTLKITNLDHMNYQNW